MFFNMAYKAQQPSWDMGTFNFSPSAQMLNNTNYGLANLLLGNYQTHTQSNGIYYGDFRYVGVEGYGQDTWRPNRRRRSTMACASPTRSDVHGRPVFQNYFVPDAYDPAQAVNIFTGAGVLRGSIVPNSGNFANGMVEEGSPGLPKGAIDHTIDVAPRVGLSWDVAGDGRTAVRAGFGIFYERYRQNNLNFDGLGNVPLSYTPRLFGGNVDDISRRSWVQVFASGQCGGVIVRATARGRIHGTSACSGSCPGGLPSTRVCRQPRYELRLSSEHQSAAARSYHFQPAAEQHTRRDQAISWLRVGEHDRVWSGKRIPRSSIPPHASVRRTLHRERQLHVVESARSRRLTTPRLAIISTSIVSGDPRASIAGIS